MTKISSKTSKNKRDLDKINDKSSSNLAINNRKINSNKVKMARSQVIISNSKINQVPKDVNKKNKVLAAKSLIISQVTRVIMTKSRNKAIRGSNKNLIANKQVVRLMMPMTLLTSKHPMTKNNLL